MVLQRFHQTPNRRFRLARHGAAAVEFALVAPVLLMLVLGAIDFGRAIMVLDILSHAARTGCRAGVLPGNGNSDIKTAVSTTLTSAGVSGAPDPTIEVLPNKSTTWTKPGDAGTAQSGDLIRVTVSVPYNQVSWLAFSYFVSSSTTLL